MKTRRRSESSSDSAVSFLIVFITAIVCAYVSYYSIESSDRKFSRDEYKLAHRTTIVLDDGECTDTHFLLDDTGDVESLLIYRYPARIASRIDARCYFADSRWNRLRPDERPKQRVFKDQFEYGTEWYPTASDSQFDAIRIEVPESDRAKSPTEQELIEQYKHAVEHQL